MAISSKFGTSAGNATVSGTLDVKDPVAPVAPPDGLKAIGPRVTFHFTGLWDKNTDYVYYDVVKDGSDNSYIAIKPKVPAGTALTDSEYWFKWSDPNQQFFDLEQTVSTYSSEIADLHDMIKDDETLINNNAQDIKTLQYGFNLVSIEKYGCSENSEDNSNALQNAINDAANKSIILLIPAKTYICASQIKLPWNINLIGVSRSESIIKFTSDAGFLADSDKNNNRICVGIKLSNFTIKGSYTFPTNYESKASTYYYNAGIRGMFTSSIIENINISNFETGMVLEQNVQPPNYNNLYNNKYGDLRLFKNIDVSYCWRGIHSVQWDTFMDTIDIHMIQESPIKASYHVSNVHIWGYGYASSFSNAQINNIEIEAPQNGSSYYLSTTKVLDIGMILTGRRNEINNAWLWNLNTISDLSNYTGYIHALIRTEAESTLIANNIIYEDNPNNTKVANYNLIGTSSGYPATMLVNGMYGNNFTSLRDSVTGITGATNISGVVNLYAKNIESSYIQKVDSVKTYQLSS